LENSRPQPEAGDRQAYPDKAYPDKAYPDKAYPDKAYPDKAYPGIPLRSPMGDVQSHQVYPPSETPTEDTSQMALPSLIPAKPSLIQQKKGYFCAFCRR